MTSPMQWLGGWEPVSRTVRAAAVVLMAAGSRSPSFLSNDALLSSLFPSCQAGRPSGSSVVCR